jgi:O-antigen/teichoic acid export membrane protein
MNKTSKTHKLVSGSFLRIIEFSANALIGILLMPFIIHSLGDEMYGLWIFIGSFLGYYGLMDFGLTSAVQRYVSQAIGQNDQKEESTIASTAFAIFAIIGIVVLLLSVLIALTAPLIIKNITEIQTFRMLLIILGLNMSLGFPLRVFTGILNAHLRFDLSTSIELVKLAVRTCLIVYFLKAGYGIISLGLITFFMDIFAYAAKYFVVKHSFSFIRLSCNNIDRKKIKSLFGYSVYTFISQVADQLRYNVDNLVIVTFVSLHQVTPYSIGARLVTYYKDLITAATGSMLVSVFSQYHAANQHDLMINRFMFMTKITGYLSFLVGGVLMMFGHSFILRWVGKQYGMSYTIMLLLLIPAIFTMTQAPSVQLLYGISKHKFFAIWNSIEGTANLILSVILAKKYGIVGVALGTAIPMVIVKLFVQPCYTCRIININIRTYYTTVFFPVIAKSTILIFVEWLFLKKYIIPDYCNLILLSLFFTLSFSAGIYFWGLSSEERNFFKPIATGLYNKMIKRNQVKEELQKIKEL